MQSVVWPISCQIQDNCIGFRHCTYGFTKPWMTVEVARLGLWPLAYYPPNAGNVHAYTGRRRSALGGTLLQPLDELQRVRANFFGKQFPRKSGLMFVALSSSQSQNWWDAYSCCAKLISSAHVQLFENWTHSITIRLSRPTAVFDCQIVVKLLAYRRMTLY